MGHRIELGELESVAAALPGIVRPACIHDKKKNKLVVAHQFNNYPPRFSSLFTTAPTSLCPQLYLCIPQARISFILIRFAISLLRLGSPILSWFQISSCVLHVMLIACLSI
jgi:hypothetical protein